MATLISIIAGFSTVVLLAAMVGLLIAFRRREAAYKATLEANQKRLDLQTARLTIFTRALPSLDALLKNSAVFEDWRTLCLDETRSLLRAQESTYWAYHEKEQLLENLLQNNLTSGSREKIKTSTQASPLGEVVNKRIPIMRVVGSGPTEETWVAIPFVVGPELQGVFEFRQRAPEKLTSRDLDLAALFVHQVALAVENRQHVSDHEKFYLELVQALADLLDSRDAISEGHTRRARNLARGIAQQMSLPQEFTYYLEFAALLHDIGNIAIDESVLRKPSKLTAEEFALVKKHPEYGFKILSSVTMLAPVSTMVLYHQERFDGSGYPAGLRGEEIPLGARIVAVLDAWMAMTTARPFRGALKPETALSEIKKGAGTQFDPAVVEAFVAALEEQGFKTEGPKRS